MASPAEIGRLLPDTLPEDFSEWDGGGSSATQPGKSKGPEVVPDSGAAQKPPAQPAEQQVAAPPMRNGQRKAASTTAAAAGADEEAFLQRLKSITANGDRQIAAATRTQPTAARSVDEVALPPVRSNGAVSNGSRNNLPSFEVAALVAADEVLFQSFRTNGTAAPAKKPANRKWMMIAAVGAAAVVLLLAVMIPLLHGKPSAVKQSAQLQPAVTDEQPEANLEKPSPATSTTVTASNPPTATDANQTSDTQAAASEEPAAPAPVQSEMMNDQLTAPERIPQNAKVQTAEDAPPSAGFNAASMAGLGGNSAVGSVLNGSAGLKVKAAPPRVVTVSAGVAVGLLIQKTAPVYPLIAKTARVSGAVVLHANISKTGAIENLQVVSGPAMLRQAATDAVRTWHYRPYKLNNEPVEIETTINVIFSLVG
jgi:protein TonB